MKLLAIFLFFILTFSSKVIAYPQDQLKECILSSKQNPIILGTTVNFKNHFRGAVSSSEASTILLESNGIDVFSLNDVAELDFYIDGADEVSPDNILIKGGGGAHTREKIVASASREFVCIVDKSKMVDKLGAFPLPIEVIPESRSLVARKIISLGGTPIYRDSFVTDQGNHILDVKGIDISQPDKIESLINNIPCVVDNGIFAFNKPNIDFVSD